MIMANNNNTNNRQQQQQQSKSLIPIKFFITQLIILLIIAAVQTNGSQKFVPNGRYGRRSDLPPLSSINNNPSSLSSSYDINQFFSDADILAMNQDAENMLMLMTMMRMNGPPQSTMDINWSANLIKQLWHLCEMNEDKIIMNRCLRSIPIIKMILMKSAATAAAKDRTFMSEIDPQSQILQQTLKHQQQQQQQQGQD
ncbi:uncharacterized protein LOC113793139 [Dermatophagoides pteronyssinus]|uniref:uncharacterized protein LOC113793139 n=1 Tax=Dermatophagoides pteronyssinus TaxID=6956 RepID=UPI003F681B1B